MDINVRLPASRVQRPSALVAALSAPLVAAGALTADAASHIESLHGDVSDDRLDPSVLVLDPGTNLVAGAFGDGDLDYIAVSVPTGYTLSSLILNPGTLTGSQFSFIAMQAGPTMTVAPSTAPSGLLGWTHFGGIDIGTDLLDDLGTGLGASGFVGPLEAGDYTLWIQELDAGPDLGYDFTLNITAVPLPGAGWLLGSGLLGLLATRRRVQDR